VNNKTTISLLLLFLVIITGLLNLDYFYNASSIAFYGFCISALVFSITPPHLYIADNKLFIITKPIALFGLWILYLIFHHFIIGGTTPIVVYCTIHFLFTCSALAFFKSSKFNFDHLAIGILIIALLESLYCIMQYMGLLESQTPLFKVTGSWVNPNITALFLALTSPFFFYLFNKKSRKIYFFGFGLLLLALSLLKCRSAFIGILISAIVFFGLEYHFIRWAKDVKNRMSIKAIVILCLLVLMSTGNYLYNSKKASSDGRKFIWKLSLMMVADKPVWGSGYGLYEKEYNLFQANYIDQGNANETELQNAGYVLVSHNEMIQNTVEGGLVGLLLFVLFLSSLVVSVRKSQRVHRPHDSSPTLSASLIHSKHQNRIFHLAYAGIISFVVMSMFHFTIQCIPVMTLFSIFTALICSQLKPIVLPKSIMESNVIRLIVSITGTAIGVFLLYSIVVTAMADRENKKASLLTEKGDFPQALKTLSAVKPELKKYVDYWKNVGIVHLKSKNYLAAITAYQQGLVNSSNPELFYGMGICYEQLGQYSNAIIQYRQLVLSNPSKFLYRFLLMQTYLKNNEIANAQNTAQGIINLKPKIPSNEVYYYKMMARKVVGGK
jgi:O-antigen polymerase